MSAQDTVRWRETSTAIELEDMEGGSIEHTEEEEVTEFPGKMGPGFISVIGSLIVVCTYSSFHGSGCCCASVRLCRLSHNHFTYNLSWMGSFHWQVSFPECTRFLISQLVGSGLSSSCYRWLYYFLSPHFDLWVPRLE
jgi:hypothetical protein